MDKASEAIHVYTVTIITLSSLGILVCVPYVVLRVWFCASRKWAEHAYNSEAVEIDGPIEEEIGFQKILSLGRRMSRAFSWTGAGDSLMASSFFCHNRHPTINVHHASRQDIGICDSLHNANRARTGSYNQIDNKSEYLTPESASKRKVSHGCQRRSTLSAEFGYMPEKQEVVSLPSPNTLRVPNVKLHMRPNANSATSLGNMSVFDHMDDNGQSYQSTDTLDYLLHSPISQGSGTSEESQQGSDNFSMENELATKKHSPNYFVRKAKLNKLSVVVEEAMQQQIVIDV